MRESICYTKLFRFMPKIYAIKIRENKFTISKRGIDLTRIFITIIGIFLFYSLLNEFAINYIPFMFRATFYIGVPYLVSYAIVARKDGKNLFKYFWSIIQYRIHIKHISFSYSPINNKIEGVDSKLLSSNLYYKG